MASNKIKITTKVDLYFIRGDSSSITFTANMDLTGATVFFTAKPTTNDDVTDTTAVISVSVTSHIDPVNGKTVIPLSATDMNVVPGKYYYDIQIKKADQVISIPTRRLEIIADTTRKTV